MPKLVGWALARGFTVFSRRLVFVSFARALSGVPANEQKSLKGIAAVRRSFYTQTCEHEPSVFFVKLVGELNFFCEVARLLVVAI